MRKKEYESYTASMELSKRFYEAEQSGNLIDEKEMRSEIERLSEFFLRDAEQVIHKTADSRIKLVKDTNQHHLLDMDEDEIRQIIDDFGIQTNDEAAEISRKRHAAEMYFGLRTALPFTSEFDVTWINGKLIHVSPGKATRLGTVLSVLQKYDNNVYVDTASKLDAMIQEAIRPSEFPIFPTPTPDKRFLSTNDLTRKVFNNPNPHKELVTTPYGRKVDVETRITFNIDDDTCRRLNLGDTERAIYEGICSVILADVGDMSSLTDLSFPYRISLSQIAKAIQRKLPNEKAQLEFLALCNYMRNIHIGLDYSEERRYALGTKKDKGRWNEHDNESLFGDQTIPNSDHLGQLEQFYALLEFRPVRGIRANNVTWGIELLEIPVLLAYESYPCRFELKPLELLPANRQQRGYKRSKRINEMESILQDRINTAIRKYRNGKRQPSEAECTIQLSTVYEKLGIADNKQARSKIRSVSEKFIQNACATGQAQYDNAKDECRYGEVYLTGYETTKKHNAIDSYILKLKKVSSANK